MDRELEVIKSISTLTTIVSGMQTCIKDLTDSLYIIKERLEQLERGNE
jgi:hypothetical protein